MIMQIMWRLQAPRRIKYQPAEMKIVLTRLRQAFMAGRSEIETIQSMFNAQRPTFNTREREPRGFL